jgi:naphthalene 1,2-dioxygenase system ferredoxin subunit
MSRWTEVAAQEDIPEDGTLPVQAGGEPVCLYNLQGQIHATHDICTHGAANLSDGFIIDHQFIECPFHQGMFDIKTGAAASAPCSVAVKSYPVKIEGGRVFVDLGN